MAIAVDANSSQVFTSGGTTQTLAHTTGSLENGLMVVGVLQSDGATDDCTGVTYNGDALTKITSIQLALGTAAFISMWYRLGPDAGTNNIVASFSSSRTAHLHGLTVSGARQVTVPLDSDSVASSSSSFDTPAVTVEGGSWSILFCGGDSGGTASNLNPDGTQRSRQDSATTSRSSEISTKGPLSAGTSLFTIEGNGGMAAIIASFASPSTFSPKVMVI